MISKLQEMKLHKMKLRFKLPIHISIPENDTSNLITNLQERKPNHTTLSNILIPHYLGRLAIERRS